MALPKRLQAIIEISGRNPEAGEPDLRLPATLESMVTRCSATLSSDSREQINCRLFEQSSYRAMGTCMYDCDHVRCDNRL